MYNYLNAMVNDIEDVFNDYNWESDNKDDLAEEMRDSLWTEDNVTGNGSGSYTFDREMAKEYVLDNMDLCKASLEELCVPKEDIVGHFLDEDWEYFDCTIRCYLLGEAIDRFLEKYSDELNIE